MITVCSEERHVRASAYFINSTVHTSKVIWALKTIEKLNECLLLISGTATWNNGSLFWQKAEVPQQSDWGQKGPMSI